MTISMDDNESNWEKDISKLKNTIMQDGAIDNKTKKLLALASAVAVGCDECVSHHKKFARNAGLKDSEIEEAILVASLIRLGSGLRHVD